MPKFYVGVVATARVEIEADTQEEAEVLAITSTSLLNSAEWSIEYCDELDEEDEDDLDDEDEDDDEDDDDEDDDDFKFANEA